jgi:hypothetical protein
MTTYCDIGYCKFQVNLMLSDVMNTNFIEIILYNLSTVL